MIFFSSSSYPHLACVDLFSIFFVIVHVSQPYRTVGKISTTTVPYLFFLSRQTRFRITDTQKQNNNNNTLTDTYNCISVPDVSVHTAKIHSGHKMLDCHKCEA